MSFLDSLTELENYRKGKHPYEFGPFLTAVLANDFVEVIAKADDRNKYDLYGYAAFLYNDMPGRTGDATRDYWGSYGAVANRIAEQRRAKAAEDAP